MNIKKNAFRGAFAALAAIAVALAGCAETKPTVRTNYNPATNFGVYRTYAYYPTLATEKEGYSTLITQDFKSAIDAELAARGFTKVDANPDVYVNFSANAVEKVDVQSTPSSSASMGVGAGGYYGYRGGLYSTWPMYPQNDVTTVRYKVGTANIDVIDAKGRQLVWEGVAEGKLSKEAMQNPAATIKSAVSEMFKEFPVKPIAPQ